MATFNKKVITKEVTLNFPRLFNPESYLGGKPKYGTTVLVDKSDKETINALTEAVNACIHEGAKTWGEKFKNIESPFKDGDNDGKYPGKHYFKCSSVNKPGLVDRTRTDIIDEEEIYSGVKARVSVGVSLYDYMGTKRGITIYLNNVQKLGEGERLAPGPSVDEDFGGANDIESLI